MLLGYEELGSKVFFLDSLMIDYSKSTDARQNKILCDFIRQGFERNQKDICGPNPKTKGIPNQLINAHGLEFRELTSLVP
jgi:hypothetical protein